MRNAFLILLATLTLVSCDMASSLIHDGTLVAEVGRHKLYSGELEPYIPDGISPEDSLVMVEKFVKSWATRWLYLDAAEKELSRQQLNVEKETEDYRTALIMYRYEQAYMESRLDTAVSDDQIEAYYEAHKESFVLREPVVKVRYVRMSSDSPYRSRLERLLRLSSDDEAGDVSEEDSLAYRSALRRTDYGGRWIAVSTLAGDMGMEPGEVLSSAKDGFVEVVNKEEGTVRMAQVTNVVGSGEAAPVEYERARIREMILSARKQDLLSGLERDLLETARADRKFVIHQ